jgi:hypothetical protein
MRVALMRVAAATAALVVLAGCVAMPSSRRARTRATTTSTTSTTTTTTTSTTVSPTTVSPTTVSPTTVPPTAARGSLAAWATPAAQVPTSPRSAEWASRYWQFADAFDHEIGVEFGFDEPSNDYSLPLYSAADATTVARVFRRPDAWNGRFDIPVGSTIPWNPAWRPADGNDGFLLIVDPTTGEEWDVWALSTPSFDRPYLKQAECSYQAESVALGFDPGSDLCAAAVTVISSPDGATADVRRYRGNYPPAGGGGLPNTAGLTTPAEVAAGVIPHALKFAVNWQLSMSGPGCPPDVTSPDDPRVGTTCGVSVAPAGQFESGDVDSTPDQLARMVPDGTRLVIDLSDQEIDAWLDARGYTGELRRTARIFAVALRDYGLIQTSSTGGGAIVQVAGARNPATAQAWRDLGIVGTGGDLLAGLFVQSRLRVLEPATNQCSSGPSHLWCWASATGY